MELKRLTQRQLNKVKSMENIAFINSGLQEFSDKLAKKIMSRTNNVWRKFTLIYYDDQINDQPLSETHIYNQQVNIDINLDFQNSFNKKDITKLESENDLNGKTNKKTYIINDDTFLNNSYKKYDFNNLTENSYEQNKAFFERFFNDNQYLIKEQYLKQIVERGTKSKNTLLKNEYHEADTSITRRILSNFLKLTQGPLLKNISFFNKSTYGLNSIYKTSPDRVTFNKEKNEIFNLNEVDKIFISDNNDNFVFDIIDNHIYNDLSDNVKENIFRLVHNNRFSFDDVIRFSIGKKLSSINQNISALFNRNIEKASNIEQYNQKHKTIQKIETQSQEINQSIQPSDMLPIFKINTLHNDIGKTYGVYNNRMYSSANNILEHIDNIDDSDIVVINEYEIASHSDFIKDNSNSLMNWINTYVKRLSSINQNISALYNDSIKNNSYTDEFSQSINSISNTEQYTQNFYQTQKIESQDKDINRSINPSDALPIVRINAQQNNANHLYDNKMYTTRANSSLEYISNIDGNDIVVIKENKPAKKGDVIAENSALFTNWINSFVKRLSSTNQNISALYNNSIKNNSYTDEFSQSINSISNTEQYAQYFKQAQETVNQNRRLNSISNTEQYTQDFYQTQKIESQDKDINRSINPSDALPIVKINELQNNVANSYDNRMFSTTDSTLEHINEVNSLQQQDNIFEQQYNVIKNIGKNVLDLTKTTVFKPDSLVKAISNSLNINNRLFKKNSDIKHVNEESSFKIEYNISPNTKNNLFSRIDNRNSLVYSDSSSSLNNENLNIINQTVKNMSMGKDSITSFTNKTINVLENIDKMTKLSYERKKESAGRKETVEAKNVTLKMILDSAKNARSNKPQKADRALIESAAELSVFIPPRYINQPDGVEGMLQDDFGQSEDSIIVNNNFVNNQQIANEFPKQTKKSITSLISDEQQNEPPKLTQTKAMELGNKARNYNWNNGEKPFIPTQTVVKENRQSEINNRVQNLNSINQQMKKSTNVIKASNAQLSTSQMKSIADMVYSKFEKQIRKELRKR